MDNLISVIIPVYNCEQFLDNSIQSLLTQTIFEKMELIFVDDGSTDNSFQIIKKYSNLYSNIKLIEQNNQGVSAARNRGLEASNGSYICFFDADDIAKPTLYEKLYYLISSNNCDISVVDYSMCFQDGTEKKHKKSMKRQFKNKKDSLKSFFTENVICTNPVDKMFRRDILTNIAFPEGYSIGEDMYFVFEALNVSQSVVIDTTESLYNYCIHPNSAMKSEFNIKHFDSVILAKRILNKYNLTDSLYDYAEANYVHESCKVLALVFKNKAEDRFSSKVSELSNILKKYSIIKAIKYMDFKHIVALELMKISPKIYMLVYDILKVG